MQKLKFQSKGRNLLALQGLLSNGEVLPLLILSKKDLPKKDDKNEEKMLSCLLSPQSVSSYRLFNLDYINLENINYISDKSRYEIYINNFLTKNKNFDIEMLKLYEVKYDIKFIEEIEPVKSGEITKEVMLVKLVGSDKWLIEGIGTM